jgi:hypothetical protein
MKWFYERFLLEPDRLAGAPYDTVSSYPHVAVCSFVNWPTGLEGKNPAAILPHCYRDSSCGFYAWRDRWQDENDTVITVLTNRTEGYMASKPDRALAINAGGQHLRWGTVPSGPTRFWKMSLRGETSSLTLADGTCFGIDFSGASGAQTMLVTSGAAEGQTVKVGGQALTFSFPGSGSPPQVTARGEVASVGRQRVSMKDGHLEFSVRGK